MDSPFLISELKIVKSLEAKNAYFHQLAKNLYSRAELQLNTRIPSLFPEYTQHDIHHSIRILESIELIIDDIDALNEFEIFLIIACSLLHDIGMGIDSAIVESLKNNSSSLTDIKYEAMVVKFEGDSHLALQELIRILHGDLSATTIRDHYSDLFVFKELGNISFTEDVMQICKSHTKDHIWLDANLSTRLVKGKYDYNPLYIAILLRLADILDFDGRRTPLFLYKLIRPKGQSDKEWTQHFIVTNVDKVKFDRDSNLKKISIHGSCSDVEIHRKFLHYIDWINSELEYAIEATTTMLSQYKLFLKPRVNLNVEHDGYTVSNYKLSIDFRSISNLLMGEKIYGEPSLGLRELIQNSIDACKVKREQEDASRKFGDDPYIGTIKIIINEEESLVTIRDNGSGMNEEIIKKYFLNIGRSYYTSDDYLLRQHQYKPIGNYGIGFLSCFMLSDKVMVRTSMSTDKYRYDIMLEKDSEYISFSRIEDPSFSGTDVEFDYASFNKVMIDSKITIEQFISKYFINETIKIAIMRSNENEVTKISSILNNLAPRSGNEQLLDISENLIDCKAFMIVKQKNTFIRSIEDIPHIKDILYYVNDTLSKSTELPIHTFLESGTFHYLDVPIYGSYMEDEFSTAYNLLDDIDEVIDRIKPERWVSLVVQAEQQSWICDNQLYNDRSDMVFDELDKHNFLAFLDCSYDFIPKVFAREVKIFSHSNKKIHVPVQEGKTFSNISYYRNKEDIKIYLRDILIPYHQFKIPSIPSCFDVEKLSVNILSQTLIPVVSRNRFDERTTSIINYSLSKAIVSSCMAALSIKETGEEQSLLREYLDSIYSEGTLLVK